LAWVRFQQRRVAEAQALGEQVLDEARARSDPWATAMMWMLVASLRLWSGRTTEAVTLAEQAQRTFTNLGDAYGGAQAGAVLGRALVMAGRVEEGFALLAASSAPARDGDGASTEGFPTRFARVAAALQIGEPHRGAPVLAEIEAAASAGLGGDDGAAVLAAAALMDGDVAAAVNHLAGARRDGVDPNVLAVEALTAAACGSGQAGALADRVDRVEGATYLDRATANLAAALEAATGDAGPGEAQRRLSIARSVVHPTDDRVAKAVVELGAAAVASRLALPEASEVAAEAEHLVASLGIDPTGWNRVFALATRAVPT
jgi:hypothetical protein